MRKLGSGIASRVGALAVSIAAIVGCGDNGVTPPDAAIDIDAPPPDPAQLQLSPLTRDFGTLVVGNTSTAMAFTVTNTGGDDSGAISAQIMGSGATNFSIETNGCTTLAANATCTVSVSFTPGSPGAKSANLVVSASPGGSVSAAIDGTGVSQGSLSINPSSNAFGNVVVGQTSATPATFTITNAGGATTGTLTVTQGGSDPGSFTKQSDTCNGQTLAANATCAITVSFSPASPGAKSASFTIQGSPGGNVNAAVTGTGLAPASVSINPSLQNFGSVVSGTQGGTQTFTVTNTGGVATGNLTNTLSGTDQGSFTIVSGNCAGVALNPNATCNVVVRFDPASVGSKAANLNVSGTPGGTASATLLGTGIAAGQITITPTSFTFANTTVGATSSSQTFTVTNTGGAATGALTTALAGNDPGHFTLVAGSNGCQGVVLAANGSCTIAVTFTPTTGGAKSASLSVSGTPGGTVTAGLSGTGIPPAAFTISPTSTDFGSVGTGTQTAFRTFTITNTGGQPSGTMTVSLTGAQASQFNFVSGCTGTLAAGASCTVQVRFAPNINGNAAANLVVAAGPISAIATLFGQGVDPAALAVNPSSLTFDGGDGANGEVLVGDNQILTFTLTNNGTEPTGTITFAETGANQGDYSSTHNCTFLPAGQSCTVTVTFAPTAPGTRTASIVASATPGGSVSVALTGDALARLQITTPSTNPYDFGNEIINTAAPDTVTVTVRNNRSTTQTLTLTPTFGADYSRVGGSCPATSGPIAGYATCTVIVQFLPTTVGTKTGSVLFSTGAGAVNQATQNFTGVGVDSLIITAATTSNFGPVARGTASAALSFTVTNPANAPTTGPIGTTITGTAFQIISNTCAGQTLAANTSCTIQVRFLPTVGGGSNQTATLSATATPGGTTSITLSGTGVEPAALQFNPSPTLAFGNVFSGETRDLTIVVSNPAGAATSGPVTFSKTGADSALYTLNQGAAQPNDCVSGVTALAAGASCNLRVRFSPTGQAFGNKNAASVTLSANPGTTSPVTIALTGTSVSTISAMPDPFDFGDRTVGSSTQQVFTVRNDSNNAVAITSANISSTDQTSVIANTCTTLASMATCQITVLYAPSSPGTITRTVTVNSPNGQSVIDIEAHALSAADVEFTFANTALTPYDLGSAVAGGNAGSGTFTLTNLGETTATGLAVFLTDMMNYSITSNNCGATLAFNATCSVTVRFNPAPGSSGDITAQLDANVTNDAGGVTPIHLTGRSVASGGIIVSPPTWDFNPTVVNTDANNNMTLVIQNTSANDEIFNGFVFPPFTIVSSNCMNPLPAGSNCTAVIGFHPTAPGTFEQRIVISIGPGTPYVVVRGRGLAAANVNVSTTAPTFPNTAVTASSTSTITLTNTGEVATGTITQSAITGADSPSFSKSGCTGTLAPAGQMGDSCTLTVTFSPTTVGAKSASFTIGATPGLATTTINLNANAVTNATLGISPVTQQNAGNRAVGALDPGGTVFTVTNGGAVASGNLTLALSNTNYVIDGAFVGAPSTCTNGAPLAAGAVCQFRVKFNPTSMGTHATNVTVSATPGGTVTGSITGMGTSALTVTPSTQNFGTVARGGTSGPITFTFTNNADVETGLLYTALAGTNATEFTIAADDCAGKVLTAFGQPNSTCTITMRFTPPSSGTAGAKAATLTVSGTPGNSAAAALSGTAN